MNDSKTNGLNTNHIKKIAESFLREIKKENKNDIFRDAKLNNNKNSMDKIILGYVFFAMESIKNSYRYGTLLDYDDLFQTSIVGLLEAFKNFDIQLDIAFTTYSQKYIIGALYKEKMLMSVPFSLTKNDVRLKSFFYSYYCEKGSPPSIKVLKKHFNLSTDKIIQYMYALETPPVSLDNELNFEDFSEANNESIFSDKDSIESCANLNDSKNTLLQKLETCLDCLDAQEKLVLKKSYGLLGEKHTSRDDIGKLFNISTASVTNIKNRALNKISKKYKNLLEDDYNELITSSQKETYVMKHY